MGILSVLEVRGIPVPDSVRTVERAEGLFAEDEV